MHLPAWIVISAAAAGGAWVWSRVDDAWDSFSESTPSPLSPTGLLVWGLAGWGAWQIVKRMR